MLSQDQQEYLQESLNRGQFFEQMIQAKGWEYLTAWYQARVQAFANGLLLTEDEDIQKYERERQRLIGIKQLLNQVKNDIKTLHENTKPTTE